MIPDPVESCDRPARRRDGNWHARSDSRARPSIHRHSSLRGPGRSPSDEFLFYFPNSMYFRSLLATPTSEPRLARSLGNTDGYTSVPVPDSGCDSQPPRRGPGVVAGGQRRPASDEHRRSIPSQPAYPGGTATRQPLAGPSPAEDTAIEPRWRRKTMINILIILQTRHKSNIYLGSPAARRRRTDRTRERGETRVRSPPVVRSRTRGKRAAPLVGRRPTGHIPRSGIAARPVARPVARGTRIAATPGDYWVLAWGASAVSWVSPVASCPPLW